MNFEMQEQQTPEELAIAEALNQDFFLQEVEDLVQRGNVGYFEGILELCDRKNLDPDMVASQIKQDKAFRAKLQKEAKVRLLK